ncbi:2-C-methyl-D-erythritol 2,4-cyclodiphosphate synthase [bacterium]|nr:2-C-methyl-D-erythritol 2,4-cyclodiphosphate synthase [bacterium]
MSDHPFRIGLGYDVHRLAAGRPLILAGVTIPFDRGLAGHSDADVLAHAVADAVLGAAGLGDIGRHFPDTDPAFAGADSIELLSRCVALAKDAGYVVVNVDATIVAQQPKMAPYAARMTANLARALGVDAGRVNVKATTEEGLGFTGRGEGIAAQAVAMLAEIP